MNMGWKKKFAFATALATGTTLTLHTINKLIHLSAHKDIFETDSSSLDYNWKFGNVSYTKQGSGAPLLLVHDLSNFSSSVEWKHVVEKFSKAYTVYTLDLLGCGRSDKPNITYTSYLYVQLITDFIKQVIKEKTSIIATGNSSSFILATCQNDKSIIDKIVLVNPTDIKQLTKNPGKKSKAFAKLINLPVFGTFVYNLYTSKDELYKLFEEHYYSDSAKIEESLITEYYANAHTGISDSKYLFSSLAGKYTTINIKSCIKDVDNSIFIYVGDEQDKYYDIALKYEEVIPSIEIVKFNKSNYLPQLEHADNFVEQTNILFTNI